MAQIQEAVFGLDLHGLRLYVNPGKANPHQNEKEQQDDGYDFFSFHHIDTVSTKTQNFLATLRGVSVTLVLPQIGVTI